MNDIRVGGKVGPGGGLLWTPGAMAEVLQAFKPHEGRPFAATFKVVRDIRSLSQNRRYHGLIVPMVREILSVGQPLPFSKDEVHWALKRAFIGVRESRLGPIPKSSKELDVPQFAAFMNESESWMATQWGIVVPQFGDDL